MAILSQPEVLEKIQTLPAIQRNICLSLLQNSPIPIKLQHLTDALNITPQQFEIAISRLRKNLTGIAPPWAIQIQRYYSTETILHKTVMDGLTNYQVWLYLTLFNAHKNANGGLTITDIVARQHHTYMTVMQGMMKLKEAKVQIIRTRTYRLIVKDDKQQDTNAGKKQTQASFDKPQKGKRTRRTSAKTC